LGLLAVGLRFFKLASFFTYPLYDDVLNAFFAFHLNQHWTWHPFFYYSQIPPLYIWLLAGFFKLTGVAPLSLWLLPALLSLACVPLSYLASRPFFSRSMSTLCALLVAASFWPLWLGRISHQMGLMVLWEWLVLWALGKFLTAPVNRSSPWLCLLGLVAGGGFYTYFAWPVVALWIALCLATRAFRKGFPASLAAFLAWVLLALLPLLVPAIRSHFGYYMTHRWLTPENKEWGLLESFYYPATLFWEGWKGYFGYAPRWGGLLNPVLGAFFFLGLGEAWRFRKLPLAQAAAAAFLLFLLPVLLTDNYSASRLTPLLPVCLVLAAAGIQALNFSSAPGKKIYLPLLLAFSFILDGINLSQTRDYTNACKEGPRYTRFVKAWELLEPKGEKAPGAVFSNFINDTRDRSLAFLTHSFNPVVNPGLAADSISWAAVLADEEYKACLDRRFTSIEWNWLDWDMRDMKASMYFIRGIYLGFIPLSNGNRRIVQQWLGAGRDLEALALADLNYVPGHPHGPILERMSGFYGDFEKDDFLKSFFWERAAQEEAMDGKEEAALEDMEKSLEAGCPRGYLYHQWGQLLVRTKQYKKAGEVYRKAGRLDSRFKAPPPVLEKLDQLATKPSGS
jgi:tetratricopeptide (TPR) repeat protein